jgi:hypothetical protein
VVFRKRRARLITELKSSCRIVCIVDASSPDALPDGGRAKHASQVARRRLSPQAAGARIRNAPHQLALAGTNRERSR